MEPWFGDEERLALDAYMREGGWLTEFRNTQAFEKAIADYVGVKHCIASNNGTTALMMINYCLGLASGDEVIVPNYTMVATPNSVVATGATPVFVDVDPDSLCLDLVATQAAITPRTKAIMLVNANGRAPHAGVDEFKRLADKHGVKLIEDSCQALGSWYDEGRHMGTVGLAAAFSFSVPKIITTGQGGVVVTNDDNLAMLARSLRAHGWTRDKKSGDLSTLALDDFNQSYEFVMPGYCVRPIEFMGAVGKEQLRKWPKMFQSRRANSIMFREMMDRFSSIIRIQEEYSATSSWFGFAMTLINEAKGKSSILVDLFKKNEIEYRPIVAGNFTRQPVMERICSEPLTVYPCADEIHFNGIFVGNDSRDLGNELKILERALCEFSNSL